MLNTAQRRNSHQVGYTPKAAASGGFLEGEFFKLAQSDVDLLVPSLVRCRRRRNLPALQHRRNRGYKDVNRVGYAFCRRFPVIHGIGKLERLPVILPIFLPNDDSVLLGDAASLFEVRTAERTINLHQSAF